MMMILKRALGTNKIKKKHKNKTNKNKTWENKWMNKIVSDKCYVFLFNLSNHYLLYWLTSQFSESRDVRVAVGLLLLLLLTCQLVNVTRVFIRTLYVWCVCVTSQQLYDPDLPWRKRYRKIVTTRANKYETKLANKYINVERRQPTKSVCLRFVIGVSLSMKEIVRSFNRRGRADVACLVRDWRGQLAFAGSAQLKVHQSNWKERWLASAECVYTLMTGLCVYIRARC